MSGRGRGGRGGRRGGRGVPRERRGGARRADRDHELEIEERAGEELPSPTKPFEGAGGGRPVFKVLKNLKREKQEQQWQLDQDFPALGVGEGKSDTTSPTKETQEVGGLESNNLVLKQRELTDKCDSKRSESPAVSNPVVGQIDLVTDDQGNFQDSLESDVGRFSHSHGEVYLYDGLCYFPVYEEWVREGIKVTEWSGGKSLVEVKENYHNYTDSLLLYLSEDEKEDEVDVECQAAEKRESRVSLEVVTSFSPEVMIQDLVSLTRQHGK